MRIQLSVIVGDEDALNDIWFTKGASGISPCAVLCSVTNKPVHTDRDRGIASLSDRDAEIPDIACADIARCGKRSDADVWKFCDDLETCHKDDLKDMEHVTGFKLNLNTLLFCKPLRPFLRPSKITVNDAMHVLFSCGIVPYEMMLCLGEVHRHCGAYFGEVRLFQEQTGFMPPTQLFSEAREKHSHDTLKAGASELLCGYPLLRAFLIEVYGPDPSEGFVQSILLLFEICDHIRALLKYPPPSEVRDRAIKLRGLVDRYLQKFIAVYGRDALKFKHHQLLHLPDMIFLLGMMVACWVLERKHIAAKASLANCKTLKQVVTTGITRMFNGQVRMLQEPGWLTILIPPENEFPEIANHLSANRVHIAARMRWNGTTLANGDVTFLNVEQTYLVVVVGCLRFDQSYGLLVKGCKRLTSGDVASTWDVDAEVSVYRLVDEGVFQPAFWRYLTATRLEVLH